MTKKYVDDYYNNGIIELTRIENLVKMNNNLTIEDHKKYTDKLVSDYDTLKYEIDELVQSLREKVVKCNPIELLSFSADKFLMTTIGITSEIQTPAQDILISHATEYIQSILISSPHNYIEDDIVTNSSDFFEEIINDIVEIHSKIQHFYGSWSAVIQKSNHEIDNDLLENIVAAQMDYLVRGKRYQVFENEYLEKLLKDHDLILEKLFNINSSVLIDGIKKLQYSLTQGKMDAFFDFMNSLDKVINEKDLLESSANISEITDKAFGLELRNVIAVTSWPESFVKELSFSINEDTTFFANKDFSGWPIIDLPIQKRPFIELTNQYYCFDYYSLVDNFYRVIQKTIKRLDPTYKWADYQQVASERMVEDIFKSLLPGCETYTSNYYPFNGIQHMAENDLIVLYDNTLIIVEVKAGSFVYTPPLIDFKAHIKSYKSLIEKADEQCSRTEIYLNSIENPNLFDNSRKSKATIDMSKILKTFKMSVTVDNINTFATKAEKLKFLQLQCNAISIGVDDLMVYREYFDSPLLFLHFLEQRYLATQEEKLILNDELDHLGMYITDNCYTYKMDCIPKGTNIQFIGYREELDTYFNSLYHPVIQVDKPVPKLPDLFLKILKYLESNCINNKSFVANYFLTFASDAKEEFCKGVEYALQRQKQVNRAVISHTTGVDNSLRYTCFVNQSTIWEPSFEQMKDYTLACLLWNKEPDRYMINLYFDENNNFIRIKLNRYTPHDISSDRLEDLKCLGEQIAQNRFQNYQKQHKSKIGRNQTCPCGSGKKYKKCCRR